MKYYAMILFMFAVASCQTSTVVKKLKGCDSLVITFNHPGTDSVLQSVSTTETKAIQKIAGFLDGKAVTPGSCDFNGNMLFFKAGRQVLPVVFKYSSDNCHEFVFDLDNKVMSTKMDNEAADFLKSLSGGKNWY